MKVSKRGGFSDRNGIKPENIEIQLKEFDQRTRVQLQNMVSQLYMVVYENEDYWKTKIQDFLRYVLGTIYSEPVATRKQYDDDEIFKIINKTIMNDDYDDVLTLIESLAQYWDEYLRENIRMYVINEQYKKKSVFEVVNSIFEREYVGYRFIEGIITPISDQNETDAINGALQSKYQPIREHLLKANLLLADRENPDYENSIKESISAIEAICGIITGMSGKDATLGKMLKKLEENGVTIHPALQSAFSTLYGYTSDASGIRHAKDIGGENATFEEAKYMLVACSAFINYLTALSA